MSVSSGHSSAAVNGESILDSPSAKKSGAAELSPSALDLLFGRAQSARLPEASWAVQCIDMKGVRDDVSSKIVVKEGSLSSALCVAKIVHIRSNMSVNVFLLGKCVKPGTFGVSAAASTLPDVEDILDTIEAVRVCSRGLGIKEYPIAEPKCAYVDPQRN